MTALSVLMSTLASPILGAAFSLLFYVIGHTSADIKDLAVRSGSGSVKMVANLIYHSLPNLEYLNVRSKVDTRRAYRHRLYRVCVLLRSALCSCVSRHRHPGISPKGIQVKKPVTILLALVLVAAAAAISRVGATLDERRYSGDIVEELTYFPSGRFLKVADLGYGTWSPM